MKKLLFLAAIAALVACAEKDNFKETEEAPIDFTNVSIEKNSKALITTADQLHDAGFGVFGVKTKSDGTTKEQVFGQLAAEGTAGGGTKVYYSSSVWTYAKKRYWDKGASQYDFFAYAPYNTITNSTPLIGTIGWTYTSPETSFTISGFKQKTTKDGMVDLMTSYLSRVGSANYTNTVDFSFSHILSNIHIKMALSDELKDDEDDNPVTVTSVSLSAIKMDGDYAYNSTHSKYEWSLTSPQATAATTFNATTKNSPAVVFASGELDVTPVDVPGLYDLLFIPQPLPTTTGTEYVIEVNYKIANEQFSRTIKLNDFTKEDNNTTVSSSEWKIGYQYNYVLVIGPTPIEFGTPGIGSWTEETYEYTID